MKEDAKNTAYIAMITASLVAGGFTIESRLDCDYVLINKENEEICIDESVKAAIENTVGVSKGFGGISFR